MSSQPTEALLSFSQVSFSYPQTPVLSDLSFSVKKGEIVGFLGVNGAGKTTSFLLATGLLKPQSGAVKIVGYDPAAGKEWAHSVGVMMAGAGLYPRLTVARNLSFFAELYGIQVDIEGHLRQHSMASQINKKAQQLSHGYRRRLALARATLHSPRLLLLDEPADGLDPGATEALHSYLKNYRNEGGAVVLTSHRLEEVERLCDRILLLSEGKIVAQGAPEELSQRVDGQGLRALILKIQAGVGLSDSKL